MHVWTACILMIVSVHSDIEFILCRQYITVDVCCLCVEWLDRWHWWWCNTGTSYWHSCLCYTSRLLLTCLPHCLTINDSAALIVIIMVNGDLATMIDDWYRLAVVRLVDLTSRVWHWLPSFHCVRLAERAYVNVTYITVSSIWDYKTSCLSRPII